MSSSQFCHVLPRFLPCPALASIRRLLVVFLSQLHSFTMVCLLLAGCTIPFFSPVTVYYILPLGTVSPSWPALLAFPPSKRWSQDLSRPKRSPVAVSRRHWQYSSPPNFDTLWFIFQVAIISYQASTTVWLSTTLLPFV